jgi:hypothetical protein
VHAVADVHVTPANSLSLAPDGAGVDTTVHVLPSQVAACPWIGAGRVPTATQLLEETHDTPLKPSAEAAAGRRANDATRMIPTTSPEALMELKRHRDSADRLNVSLPLPRSDESCGVGWRTGNRR